MGNIKLIKAAFDTKVELEHASVVAGFPSPADDYRHETLDFNRDYIPHPYATFYGDVEGDSMQPSWNPSAVTRPTTSLSITAIGVRQTFNNIVIYRNWQELNGEEHYKIEVRKVESVKWLQTV